MQLALLSPAQQIVLIMKRIYERGMTTTSGGNLSILDENETMWITPSGIDKGSLAEEDIVCIHKDGTIHGKHKPSVEYLFHQSIYAARKDVRAVLHAHPPALVSFSMVGLLPDTHLVPRFSKICGAAEIAPYGLPGSLDLGQKIVSVLNKGINVVLLENHGTVVVSDNLPNAFKVFETFDYCARMEINARRIGKTISLDHEDLNQLKYPASKVNEYGEYKPDSCEEHIRNDMCHYIHRAYNQGLFISTQGTYSKRLDPSSFLIMPHDTDRNLVEPNELVHIKDGLKEQGKTPDEDVLLHQAIYAENPYVDAIITAQPIHLMAYAITQAAFDSRTIPESYMVLRQVQKVTYGTPLEQISRMFSKKTPILLVENDCAIITASSLLNAYDRLEVADYSAKALIACSILGSVNIIDDDKIRDIEVAFKLD